MSDASQCLARIQRLKLTADGYCPGCAFNLEMMFRSHARATRLGCLYLDFFKIIQNYEYTADLCKSLPKYTAFCLHDNVTAWLQASVDSVVRNYKIGGGLFSFVF